MVGAMTPMSHGDDFAPDISEILGWDTAAHPTRRQSRPVIHAGTWGKPHQSRPTPAPGLTALSPATTQVLRQMAYSLVAINQEVMAGNLRPHPTMGMQPGVIRDVDSNPWSATDVMDELAALEGL